MLKEIAIIGLLGVSMMVPSNFEETFERTFQETLEKTNQAELEKKERLKSEPQKEASVLLEEFKERVNKMAGHEFYDEVDLGNGCYVLTTNDVMDSDYERVMLVRIEDNEAKCLFSSKENNTWGETNNKIDSIRVNVLEDHGYPNVVIFRSNDEFKRFELYQFNEIYEGITKLGDGELNLTTNGYNGLSEYKYLIKE